MGVVWLIRLTVEVLAFFLQRTVILFPLLLTEKLNINFLCLKS